MAITVEIDIDDELLAEAETMAEELGITLSELFNEAVKRYSDEYAENVLYTEEIDE
jgi:antitoxin component of RelBE/YafQ-DinJ toxin-antitoxin module